VGKRAVENAAPRKSPKAGLFHFFHRPGYDGLTFRFHPDKKEEKKNS
jgi:hypothetical protein